MKYTSDQLMEKLWIAIAWRLPRQLVYWCAVRLTSNNWLTNPDGRSVSDALKAWRENKPPEKI